jgi:multidrug efflux pump subunit AcrA (membrane-fusion protein)
MARGGHDVKTFEIDREPVTPAHHDGDDRNWQRPPRTSRAPAWLLRGVVVAALVAAGAWAWYSNVRATRPAMDMNVRASAATAVFPVVTAAVELGAVTGIVSYTGSVAPFSEEDIFPRVTGRILEMPVYPGDAVRAGQVLARLDDVELTSRVREAEAMAATAEANRAQMEADLLAARHGIAQMDRELAMVEAELEYARAVASRSERLVDVGAISRQEYENERSLAASLEAKRAAAQAKLEQSRAMEAAARRKVEAAEAMLAQGRATARTATVVRDYVTIVAPSSGYVVKRLVPPGVLVQPGMPILKVARIDRVRLQANVGERDVARVRVGSPVVVTALGAAVEPLTARVTAVFPFVDPGARTAIVEAVVDNASRRFLPGQYVQMAFVTGERGDALTVPRGAISRLGGTATVWVVTDGRAERREVTTGLENADRIEIRAGLAAGERVITRGQESLFAGARVAEGAERPRETPPPTPDAPRKEDGHAGH